MNKNIIKNRLTDRFISEEVTPGISVTDAAKKESKEINKDGVKAIEKDTKPFSKLPKPDKNASKMATNKFNYVDDNEKTYHDEMEILNGQEMIKYRSETGKEFKDRVEKGMEGDSTMGNAVGANAEQVEGVSSDDFGKNLIKRVKDSGEKRAKAEIQTYGMGDVQIPTGNKVQVATTAIGSKPVAGDETKVIKPTPIKTKIKTVSENNNNTTQIKESMKRLKFKKEFNGVGNALNLIPETYKVDKKEFEMTDGNETYRIRWEGNLTEGKTIVVTAADKKMVNEDIARMKALFNYKSEDTLGLVKGNARLDENVAFSDIWKKTRDIMEGVEGTQAPKPKEGEWEKISMPQGKEAKKHIEGSVSKDKGTQAPKPKEGEWEEINVPQSKDAKEDIEGSVAKDKSSAPKPKEGEWEEINVSHAKEAKEDIETGKGTKLAKSAKVVKETEAKAPKAKTGEWEEINVPHAKEAKEDIETGKGTKLAKSAKVVKEEEEEEKKEDDDNEEGGEEKADDFYKSDEDDSTDDEKEPSAKDIKGEVPSLASDEDDEVAIPAIPVKGLDGPKLMVSQSTGQHYLLQNGKHLLNDAMGNPLPVPVEYVELAKKNPALALEKIQSESESIQGEPESEEVTEYGDEHPVATADAVANMKLGKEEPKA